MKRFYGFDKPVHIRYLTWLWNVLHLDLGHVVQSTRIRSGT